MELSLVRGAPRAVGDEVLFCGAGWGGVEKRLTCRVSRPQRSKGFTHSDSLNPHNRPESWALERPHIMEGETEALGGK